MLISADIAFFRRDSGNPIASLMVAILCLEKGRLQGGKRKMLERGGYKENFPTAKQYNILKWSINHSKYIDRISLSMYNDVVEKRLLPFSIHCCKLHNFAAAFFKRHDDAEV